MLHILSLRGMKPLTVAVMNDVLGSEINRGESEARTDKRGLAAYYRVGLRCIEKWLYSGVIVGRMKGRMPVRLRTSVRYVRRGAARVKTSPQRPG